MYTMNNFLTCPSKCEKLLIFFCRSSIFIFRTHTFSRQLQIKQAHIVTEIDMEYDQLIE